jgi:hypothetical protein
MLGCEVVLYATTIEKISTPTADLHLESVLPTSEFCQMYLRFLRAHTKNTGGGRQRVSTATTIKAAITRDMKLH